eukprot:300132-Amphidinium_carterae.1
MSTLGTWAHLWHGVKDKQVNSPTDLANEPGNVPKRVTSASQGGLVRKRVKVLLHTWNGCEEQLKHQAICCNSAL